MGMTSTYLRYFSRYKKQEKEKIFNLNGLFLVIFTGLGIISLAVGVVIAFNADWIFSSGLNSSETNLASHLFIILSINIFLLMPKTVFSVMALAYEKFVFINILNLAHSFFLPLLSVIVLFYGYRSIGMSFVVLVLTVFELIINYIYCRQYIKIGFDFRNLPFSILPDMFSFSIFIMLQGLMDQVNWQLEKILLATYKGSTSIAIYTIGVQINQLFMMLPAVFSGVVGPQIYQLIQRKSTKDINDLWIKISRYQFYVVYFIFLAFVLWGRKFIELWLGIEFLNVYYVSLLLMGPIIIHLCQSSVGSEVLRGYNKHKEWVTVTLFLSILGFFISIPFIKKYGAIGAAVGNAIVSTLVANIYTNWYYYKKVNFEVKKFFLNIFRLVPYSAVALFWGILLNNNTYISCWGDFWKCILMYVCMYVFAVWVFGMNEEEKKIVRSFIKI